MIGTATGYNLDRRQVIIGIADKLYLGPRTGSNGDRGHNGDSGQVIIGTANLEERSIDQVHLNPI